MTKGKARAIAKPSGTSQHCNGCQSVHQGPNKLCEKCNDLFQRICDPNGSNSDKLLAAIMRESRARQRGRLVHKLCRFSDTRLQELRVRYDDLMRTHLALKKRDTRSEALRLIRKRLGFKEKAAQANLGSAFNVADIVTHFNRAQIKSSKRGLIKRSYIKTQATDCQRLSKLLRRPDIKRQLHSLTGIAEHIAPNTELVYEYVPLTYLLNDGFKIYLGRVEKDHAAKTKYILQSALQSEIVEMIVANLLLQHTQYGSAVWITLGPGTNTVDPRTISSLMKIKEIIKDHAKRYWGYKEGELATIRLCKLDVARDFLGSFIPHDPAEAFGAMKELLTAELRLIFSLPEKNFLTGGSEIGDIRVTKGGNTLSTCFQFDVKDSDGAKILTIKVYDKIMDLISREATHLVGSSIRQIVGSKRILNQFNGRVSHSQRAGMTRLELSIHEIAFQKYNITQPSFKTLWHRRVIAAMEALMQNFLNDEQTVLHCYRRVHIPQLLSHISTAKVNILAIGKKSCWMVNAATPHKGHFIGTENGTSLYEKTQVVQQWERIRMFAAKHAAAGSTVVVYWLHQRRNQLSQVAQFKKDSQSRVQLPGCSLPFINGITLPPFIDGPITSEESMHLKVDGWVKAVKGIGQAIKVTKFYDSVTAAEKPASNADNH